VFKETSMQYEKALLTSSSSERAGSLSRADPAVLLCDDESPVKDLVTPCLCTAHTHAFHEMMMSADDTTHTNHKQQFNTRSCTQYKTSRSLYYLQIWLNWGPTNKDYKGFLSLLFITIFFVIQSILKTSEKQLSTIENDLTCTLKQHCLSPASTLI